MKPKTEKTRHTYVYMNIYTYVSHVSLFVVLIFASAICVGQLVSYHLLGWSSHSTSNTAWGPMS